MPDSVDVLIAGLSDRSSQKRRGAARQIRAMARSSVEDDRLSSALYAAFLKEKADPRTWETKVEMVHALGLLKHQPALADLGEIVDRNEPHDMMTIAAATAYCRISRSSLQDARPVLALLAFGDFSVATGALLALGCDRMLPPEDEIASILGYAIRLHHATGFGDPRYGAAVAAAGWESSDVELFLSKCLTSPDSGVVEAAKSSLKKKYVKCR